MACLLAGLLAWGAGPAGANALGGTLAQPQPQPQSQSQSLPPPLPTPLPWFEGDRPGAQALQAVELLSAAASHGLDPRDYDVPALQQAILAASQGLAAPDAPARLSPALTASMQRYLGDLRNGRIDPGQVHQRFTPPPRVPYDAAAALQAAFMQRRLAQAVDEAAPSLPQYRLLREALAQYRLLAEHPAWAQPLPPLPTPARRGDPAKLAPDQPWAGLPALAERLSALGDLSAGPLALPLTAAPLAAPQTGGPLVPPLAAGTSAPPPAAGTTAAPITAGTSVAPVPAGTPAPPLYEGVLVDAVAAFQRRHGLTADGVIGRATLAQLQVAPAARIRQIELTMERLRWTPLTRGPRMIAVNIPEFVLRAYEVVDGRPVVQVQMRVIVGRALNTRTPLFDEDMRFIEFSPYWNVPPSIARKELVPRLRRDPGHFTQEGFEFVTKGGSVDTTLSAAALDAVMAGQSRIRQRPGPKNALGDIKFVFPNSENIYLHHTPSVSLFDRDRRDLSHGCIRVEEPVALAKFVLAGEPEWTEERIRTAMGRGQSATLRLVEPLPVLIAYGTSLVKGGRIHFFDDIYGHDRLLDAALRKRSSERPGSRERP